MADPLNNSGSGAAQAAASARISGRSNSLKYASDNAFVRAVHSLTTGPFGPVLVLVVVAAVGVSLYFPLRDLYIAYRSQAILEEQIAIREAYNEQLEEEVEALLSEEGVQDLARKELGMVMEGETAVNVTGLDEDGNAIVESSSDDAADADDADDADAGEADADDAADDSDDADSDDADSDDADSDDADAEEAGDDSSSEDSGSAASDAAGASSSAADASADESSTESATSTPTTTAEVEAAEAAVYENSAWYWKALDAFFGFDGTGGQAVVSTGE